jgi:hypothetical protein
MQIRFKERPVVKPDNRHDFGTEVCEIILEFETGLCCLKESLGQDVLALTAARFWLRPPLQTTVKKPAFPVEIAVQSLKALARSPLHWRHQFVPVFCVHSHASKAGDSISIDGNWPRIC